MTELFQIVRPSEAHEYTGERMSKGHDLETELEHLHRYYLARSLAAGLDVLDIASGEGYGTAMLAQVARSVVGVDIDAEAVAHAQRTYAQGNLEFRQGSTTAIPLDDDSIDLLVSFETLEHFADHDTFFREAKRLLRPAGRLVISTPNRDVYSPVGATPNPFHVRELNQPEFEALLGRHFSRYTLLTQRAFVGSTILSTEATGKASLPLVFDRRGPSEVAASVGMEAPRYFIALCSDAALGERADSLLVETDDIAGLTREIPWLRQEIAERIEIQQQERAGHAEAIRAEQAATAQAVRAEARMRATAARQMSDIRRNLVQLGDELARRDAEVRRLRGLWPRAELQRLKLDLAQERAERIRLAADNAALSAVTQTTMGQLVQSLRRIAARQPRLAVLAVRALHVVRRLRHGRARWALRQQRRADLATLAGSPLFDHAWYRGRYLADQPGADPVLHYLWLGAAAGYHPHPLFDTAWYAARHPALNLANPFADYLRRGMAANEDPHPLFDTAFYCAQAPEASGQALQHYATRAPGDMRCPTPFFDVVGYRADNLDVLSAQLDPVAHFSTTGATEDRNPHALFDTAWYRASHLGGAREINPLAHWLREGAAASLSPHPLFAGIQPTDTALSFSPPSATPAVSVIIPVYGRMLDTLRCLYALARRSGDVPFEVILADDCPAAPVAPLLAWIAGLRTHVNPVNMGFLRNCNGAARLARGRHIVFLNNDTVVHEDWLAPLVRLADSDPSIGIVGCKLLNRDGTVQEAGGVLLDDGWGQPYGAGQDPALPELNYVREVDVVIGASFLIRREAFEAARGFDDQYAPAYYEEFDLAFTLRERGLRVMYQPASVVTHLDGSSYGTAERDALSTRNHAKFCRKWAHAVGGQPSRRAPPFISRQRPAAGTILVMNDRVPEPDKNAGDVAVARYLSLMVSLGLRVVYYPHDGRASQPYTAQLEQQGVEVLYHPVSFTEWLRENGRFLDYVWASRPYVSGHLIDQLQRDTGAPILYLTSDLHYLREMRRYALDRDPMALDEAARVRDIELAIFAKVDCVLSFSEDEAQMIREVQPRATVRVLPLSFYDAVPAAAQAPSFSGRRKLLFVGGFNHVPNVDAALWLVREIMPALWRTHPDAVVRIVGAEPPAELRALNGPRVEIAGHLPDLAASYAEARISVNPLRFGAGVKGKIVASLAAGLPVVTTPIGNEGIRLRDGVEVLLGDTADAIAAQIASLLDDDERCRALAEAGLVVIAQRFSYQTARTQLIEILGLRPAP